MPKQTAVVLFRDCDTRQCAPQDGVCPATRVCKPGILEQEAPGECPMVFPSDYCQACGDCARACPRQAIRMEAR
jgi:ferredoxin